MPLPVVLLLVAIVPLAIVPVIVRVRRVEVVDQLLFLVRVPARHVEPETFQLYVQLLLLHLRDLQDLCIILGLLLIRPPCAHRHLSGPPPL